MPTPRPERAEAAATCSSCSQLKEDCCRREIAPRSRKQAKSYRNVWSEQLHGWPTLHPVPTPATQEARQPLPTTRLPSHIGRASANNELGRAGRDLSTLRTTDGGRNTNTSGDGCPVAKEIRCCCPLLSQCLPPHSCRASKRKFAQCYKAGWVGTDRFLPNIRFPFLS